MDLKHLRLFGPSPPFQHRQPFTPEATRRAKTYPDLPLLPLHIRLAKVGLCAMSLLEKPKHSPRPSLSNAARISITGNGPKRRKRKNTYNQPLFRELEGSLVSVAVPHTPIRGVIVSPPWCHTSSQGQYHLTSIGGTLGRLTKGPFASDP